MHVFGLALPTVHSSCVEKLFLSGLTTDHTYSTFPRLFLRVPVEARLAVKRFADQAVCSSDASMTDDIGSCAELRLFLSQMNRKVVAWSVAEVRLC